MWLLLLGASLAALLTLRAMTASRDFRLDSDRFDEEHAEADGIETIAADLVFAGQASRWAQAPATDTLSVDGHVLDAHVANEDLFLDVNKADFKQIDGVLHDHGYDAATRVALLGRIAAVRGNGRLLASYADVAALGRGLVEVGSEDCLLQVLSPFGGSGQSSGGIRAGSVIRISFAHGGLHHLQTLRLVAANDRPYALLDDYHAICAGRRG